MSIFSKVATTKIPSNDFRDLTYNNKFDAQLGLLYPVHVEEIVPGDIFYAGHGAMIRTQPMVTPVMQNFRYNIRWFFVPNRLIWENFESFITDQEKGKSDLGSNHVHPYLTGKNPIDYLHDLLGIPVIDPSSPFSPDDFVNAGLPVNALPFRAYNLIWNEYFRDQNLDDASDVSLGDGPDIVDYHLLPVSWKKDYFTSALPFAQRGDAVQLLGTVVYNNPDHNYQNYVDPATGAPLAVLGDAVFNRDNNGNVHLYSEESPNSEIANMDPNGTLQAAVEFSAIRRANAIQKFLEKSAVGGNRYSELLLAHFGVRSSDASLQRPQYLGGGSAPINVTPVEQNSSTDAVSPQGNLAGKGVGVGSMFMNKRTLFTEHGWLLGLAFIRPDADYHQGLRRQMVKYDRFDYYWHYFQNIGEQEIHNWEIFADLNDGDLKDSFGYQSRYAEYKWHGNEIHGQFRKALRSWVAPRWFTQMPTLSSDFVHVDLNIAPNMAVSPDEFPPFMVEALNVVHARRPMYYFNRGTL